MKEKMSFTQLSIIIAVVATIVFPPAGIIVFAIRMAFEKRLHRTDTDYMLSPAIALIAASIFYEALLLIILGAEDDIFIILAMFALPLIAGIALLIIRHSLRRHDYLARLCVTVIERGHLTELKKIAECLCLNEAQTAKLIAELAAENRLSCTLPEGATKLTAPWADIPYVCPNCDARFEITLGINVTCPYCGAPIEK